MGLAGACAAALSQEEILVLGGYSSDDFNALGYILNVHSSEWQKRSWAWLKQTGPAMDLSCASVFWKHVSPSILVAGGWNNSALMTTELFVSQEERVLSVAQHSLTQTKPSLPIRLRSAVMTDLNQRPLLVGGVICEG